MSVATNAAVALAFECGEEAPPAYGILAALKNAGVTATFFLDGLWAERETDVVRAIASAGHELGNHGHGHPDWTALDDAAIRSNLDLVESIAVRSGARTTKPWALPPKGAIDDRVAAVLAAAGYRYVNPHPLDANTYGPPTREAVKRRALEEATDGAVMVVHTGRWPSTHAVADLVADLPARGFRLTTLSALGREPTYPRR